MRTAFRIDEATALRKIVENTEHLYIHQNSEANYLILFQFEK